MKAAHFGVRYAAMPRGPGSGRCGSRPFRARDFLDHFGGVSGEFPWPRKATQFLRPPRLSHWKGEQGSSKPQRNFL